MRTATAIVVFTSTVIQVAAVQTALETPIIPVCAQNCLELAIPTTSCSPGDIKCQCSDIELAYVVSACMLKNCTMAETLDATKFQAIICDNPHPSATRKVVVSTITVYTIAFISVGLRLAGKILAKLISLDDWFVVVAMLITTIPVGCVLAMTNLGFGKHLWDLQHGHLLRSLRLFYISSIIYIFVLFLLKVSLISFYLQIFISRRFRIVSYALLAAIVTSSLVILLLTVFSCTPLAYFWDRDLKGKCRNVSALAYANSAVAIVQDIAILILPLPWIYRLNMNWRQKAAVGVMLSIGTFACITTIIRMRSLLLFKISIDPTWDYVPVTIWTELELACGFICVSLPSIRLLFKHTCIRRRGVHSTSSHPSYKPRRANITPDSMPKQVPARRKAFSWFPMPSHSKMPPSGSYELSGSTKSDMYGWEEAKDHVKGPRVNHISEDFGGSAACGSNDDLITALPRIGCLPDKSFRRKDLE